MRSNRDAAPFSRAAAILLSVGLLVPFMTSCDGMGNHADLRWNEPVTLASGDTVNIRRHVEMWHDRALGGGFSSVPVYRTSSIELIGSGARFPVWSAPMVPIVLDKDPAAGEWIVIAGADGCDFWSRNGRPRPPYWAFRLRDGQWYRDAIPEAFHRRVANLFVEFDVADESDALNEHIKERKQSQATNPKHSEQYSSVNVAYEKGCDRAPSEPIGHNELDLRNFRSLQ